MALCSPHNAVQPHRTMPQCRHALTGQFVPWLRFALTSTMTCQVFSCVRRIAAVAEANAGCFRIPELFVREVPGGSTGAEPWAWFASVEIRDGVDIWTRLVLVYVQSKPCQSGMEACRGHVVWVMMNRQLFRRLSYLDS